MKNNPETASKLQTGLTVHEISSIVSKRWCEMIRDLKNEWHNKARHRTLELSVQRSNVYITLQQLIEKSLL